MKNIIRTSLELSTLIACAALVGGCSSSESSRGGAGYSDTQPASAYSGTAPGSTTGEGAMAGKESAATGNEVVIPLYQETVNVGKREVDAGTVHLKKKVVTETVNQPVELRHETLSIERQPATSAASSATNQGQPFQEQDFTIQLHREEPVLQKQIVQSGSVVAQRQQQVEQRNVATTVRREDVAVDKGDAQNVRMSENVGVATSPGGQSQGAGSGASTAGPITEVTALTQVTDPQSVAGRPVQLSNAKVQEVISPHLIAIGDDTQRIYAYSQQPIQDLKVGDQVTLTGTVRQPRVAPSAAEAMGAETGKLNSRPFYIDVQSAQVSNQ